MDDNDFKFIPNPSLSDLMGKQSVRVTFKLSEKAIDALSIVAVHMGIKQKSLFDHLLDDMQSLGAIAKKLEPEKFRKVKRVQKTYVLSRNTLRQLEEACKVYGAPRDALVEFSIRRLEEIIEHEREKHKYRKKLLEEYVALMKVQEEGLKKALKALGPDDPMVRSLENAFSAGLKAYRDMDRFVEKGSIIEDF